MIEFIIEVWWVFTTLFLHPAVVIPSVIGGVLGGVAYYFLLKKEQEREEKKKNGKNCIIGRV